MKYFIQNLSYFRTATMLFLEILELYIMVKNKNILLNCAIAKTMLKAFHLYFFEVGQRFMIPAAIIGIHKLPCHLRCGQINGRISPTNCCENTPDQQVIVSGLLDGTSSSKQRRSKVVNYSKRYVCGKM